MRCYIGLGSNLDDPLAQILTASQALEQIPHSRLLALSSCYRSAPLAGMNQPWYINRVAALDTDLAPEALLDALQAIEQQQGRNRTARWEPRTIDLDLLLYGEVMIDTPRLRVPHPEMAQRNFVLHPLAELAGNLILPSGQTLAQLRENCPDSGLVRIGLTAPGKPIDRPEGAISS